MIAFILIPLGICVYEILSLILPLKLPLWVRILSYLILISGLTKFFMYRQSTTGIEIVQLPYFMSLCVAVIFNFIIVAFFILLVKDIIFILYKIFVRGEFPSYYAALFAFSIALVATLYGTYEGLKTPEIVTHEVCIKNLGSKFENFKIALLADIHADELTDYKAVQKIVDKTNALSPDLILIAGDFVDGSVKNNKKNLEPIKNLNAKYGVYGVTGNHEYYFDFQGWLKEIQDFGVKLLNNERIILSSGNSKLIIAGVPDMGSDLISALKDAPENVPIILIEHRPVNAKENSKYNIALQVSGHTHGGQMPGIYYLVKRANKGFVRGWYDVDGMKLFVSPGTSQWNGFALRLFDPSEIRNMI